MVVRKRLLHAQVLAVAMEDLCRAREACIKVRADAPIGGPHYRAAYGVMQAIDGFAEVVTGDRAHFHARLCSPPGPSSP
ncbi:hypothetical protein [Roseococcus pinisoli]|uniref:Uncharacterized protein n=1 Tax=Roseococcus pinisoli TaxID=2835040 RepID=A0ABS5QC70_9PROT|nr:hypothetical protein [Roseococcus pinisoli]MBS7810560.1 hypothetical protein [Roseococcus pinisoli]